jgi:hypothetical protein
MKGEVCTHQNTQRNSFVENWDIYFKKSKIAVFFSLA